MTHPNAFDTRHKLVVFFTPFTFTKAKESNDQVYSGNLSTTIRIRVLNARYYFIAYVPEKS